MIIVYILITLGVFFAMEGVTWLTHRFVMHGFLWYLHEDHHQKGSGFFEKNDLFFVVFAIPSFLCCLLGANTGKWWLVSIGIGIMLYGAAYFLVHDIIIHQRFRLFSKTNNKYVKAIRWAHKMHHKHIGKEEGESFGMLMVAKKYWDKVKRDEAYKNKFAGVDVNTLGREK